MNRRKFIKKGGLFVPVTLAGLNIIVAKSQTLPHRRKAFRSAGGGAIVFDASSSQTGFSGTTLTWNHTVGAGANNCVFVGIGSTESNIVSGVTCNAVPMTSLWGLEDLAPTVRSHGYIITGVTAGVRQIVVTFTGAISTAAAGAFSFTGVNQATPNRAAFNSPNPNHSPSNTSIAVSNAISGDFIVDCAGVFDDSITPHVDQTTYLIEWDGLFGGSRSFGISGKFATGSTTMQWTHIGTYWATGAVALIPA
jgi:hypothetical protein